MHELYLFGLVLAGSPAFGLKALLLGMGSEVSSYGEKSKLALDVMGIGLSVSLISFILTSILSLEPLFLCLLIIGLIGAFGVLISLNRDSGSKNNLPNENKLSDDEIKDIIKDRGLDDLIEEDKDSKMSE